MRLSLNFQRRMALLMSTVAVASFTGGSCARFPDEIKLLQGVGDASIATSTAGLGKQVGTDFNNIFGKPGTAFLQSIWDNFVARQFPRGQDGTKIVLE